ncbi:MAG: hypothetical protein K2H47_00640 [Muribaculaceae bacterium]|nr:hypothetical protein [Muribaculaceae bacterium]
MLNRIFFILTALFLLTVTEVRSEERDTLFTAAKAKEISISSSNAVISVTVNRIDNGSENYYYQTSVPGAKEDNITTVSIVKEISDISITEIDNRDVEIHFLDSGENPMQFIFPLPDPANREVKSYIGAKNMDFGIKLSQKGRSKWTLVSDGLGLGWIIPVNATPSLPSSMGRSLEGAWNIILGVRWSYGPHSISTGLGLNWRNYVMKNSLYFHKNYDESITLNEYSIGMKKGRSTLSTFSLQIPVLYNIGFGRHRDFSFAVGPIVNFNTGGHIETRYKFEARDYTVKTYNIHQNPVTVDVMGIIGWSGLGIYARYSPMKVLRSSTGLDFSAFSTGILLWF